MEFVTREPWCVAEHKLAEEFGLKISKATGSLSEFLREEVELADFDEREIEQEFQENPALLIDFCRRWHWDCEEHDYGEEWDPSEGNQQEDSSRGTPVGICQGFMVLGALFYLYAKKKPDELLDYIKRKRIPHARKTARDVLRVYASAIENERPN